MKWCKSVGARYGQQGREGWRSHQPRSQSVCIGFWPVFPGPRTGSRSYFSEDDLEVFSTVSASLGAVRAVQEARESQPPRGQRISQVAKSVRSSRRRRRGDCGRYHGFGTATQNQQTSGMWPAEWNLKGQLWNLLTMNNLSGVILPMVQVWSKEAPDCSRCQIVKEHHRTFWTCWRQRVHYVYCRWLQTVEVLPQSLKSTPRSVHDVMSEVEEEAVVPGAFRTHNDESHESEFVTESIPSHRKVGGD